MKLHSFGAALWLLPDPATRIPGIGWEARGGLQIIQWQDEAAPPRRRSSLRCRAIALGR